MNFKINFNKLKTALDNAVKHNVDLDKNIDTTKAMLNYNLSQQGYYQRLLLNAIRGVKNSSVQLHQLFQTDANAQEKLNELTEMVPEIETTDLDRLKKIVNKMDLLIKQIEFPSEKEKLVYIPSRIPVDIKSEVTADLNELERCYKNKCYRSAVVLCGRVLEIALHRKYFDVTGNDILEKSPGIGLGNLIAKLKEKNVNLDPALTNQIHLVNQVRIFSVHKKKEAFYPSEQQTQAMVLYTLDILEKIFSK
ncbi:MAG: hypothetical protein KAU20_05065 [Nanoarchaeota archaeon]|nr:hypothetical protein [Nanoarchaeota archaeon]